MFPVSDFISATLPVAAGRSDSITVTAKPPVDPKWIYLGVAFVVGLVVLKAVRK